MKQANEILDALSEVYTDFKQPENEQGKLKLL